VIKLRDLAITAALTASLGLGGCVTLFPKSKPAQLYRFGETIGLSGDQTAAAAGPVTDLRLTTDFTRAPEGDRILTTSGAETAFVAQSRWVSPASVLFDEASTRAFEASGAPLRLMRRGDVGPSAATLRLDVETFEADYAPGWEGAPTVVVRVRAFLVPPAASGAPTPRPVAQIFESRQPADQNRVSAIVKAYDAATAEVLGQIVTWTTARATPVS
jgi:cholesterol transport system auxiliary component